MDRQVSRSAGAVIAGAVAAFGSLWFLSVALLPVAGALPESFLQNHGFVAVALTYGVGVVTVAGTTGVVVGYLAPSRPVLHAIGAALLILAVSTAIAGASSLPQGWQMVGQLAQVALMIGVTVWTSRIARSRGTIIAPVA